MLILTSFGKSRKYTATSCTSSEWFDASCAVKSTSCASTVCLGWFVRSGTWHNCRSLRSPRRRRSRIWISMNSSRPKRPASHKPFASSMSTSTTIWHAKHTRSNVLTSLGKLTISCPDWKLSLPTKTLVHLLQPSLREGRVRLSESARLAGQSWSTCSQSFKHSSKRLT